MTVGLTELVAVFAVLSVVTGVMIYSGSAAASSATVLACKESVANLETIVQVYESQHGGTVPSLGDLMSGPSPYLKSLPGSSAFSLTISGGVVNVAAPASAQPVAATRVNACAGAATS